MSRFVTSIVLALVLQACGQTGDQNFKRAETPAAKPSEVKTSSFATSGVTIKEATERLFQNPYDTDAVYFLSQKNGTPDALSVLIKRVSQDGTQYSRWLFNCVDRTAQNIGVGSSIQAVDIAMNSMPTKSQSYEANSKLGAIANTVCQ